MVSIKELRKICQKPQDCHNYHSILGKIYRIFSIYLTKMLIFTPIKANHVTMLMILWGFMVGFFFSIGTYKYMLIGAILLEFLFVIDLVDGELARYKKMTSLNGVFLDLVAHLTNFAGPFIGLTIGLYKSNPNMGVILAGLSAGVFSVLCLTVQPVKHHVIIKELVEHVKIVERIKSIKTHKEVTKEATKKNILKSIGKVVSYLYDEFYAVKLILLAAIFNKLYWVLLFYGLTFPLIWLVKLIHEYRVGYKPYGYLLESYKK